MLPLKFHDLRWGNSFSGGNSGKRLTAVSCLSSWGINLSLLMTGTWQQNAASVTLVFSWRGNNDIFPNLFKTVPTFHKHRMWFWYIYPRELWHGSWLIICTLCIFTLNKSVSWALLFIRRYFSFDFLIPNLPLQPFVCRSLNCNVWYFLQNIRLKCAQLCCDIPPFFCALLCNILPGPYHMLTKDQVIEIKRKNQWIVFVLTSKIFSKGPHQKQSNWIYIT